MHAHVHAPSGAALTPSRLEVCDIEVPAGLEALISQVTQAEVTTGKVDELRFRTRARKRTAAPAEPDQRLTSTLWERRAQQWWAAEGSCDSSRDSVN